MLADIYAHSRPSTRSLPMDKSFRNRTGSTAIITLSMLQAALIPPTLISSSITTPALHPGQCHFSLEITCILNPVLRRLGLRIAEVTSLCRTLPTTTSTPRPSALMVALANAISLGLLPHASQMTTVLASKCLISVPTRRML